MPSSDDGMAAGSSYAVNAVLEDGPASPISAADMLTRSLRRTPRRTTTPTRKLFPDNLDSLAPGMTPTSRNRPNSRKSTTAQKTPQRSALRPRVSSILSSHLKTPSSSKQRESDSTSTISKARNEQTLETPRATPGNRSILRGDYSVVVGKRKARDSEDSFTLQARATQFGGWGSGREESPMDMLRRLVMAPGRLGSPSEASETMDSIEQQLQEGRQSMANTSLAVSDAGQARRMARQSQLNDMLSDSFGLETGGNRSVGMITGKEGDFPLPEEEIEMLRKESSLLSNIVDDNDREAELERRLADGSTRFDETITSIAASSIKRFEDLERSMETDLSNEPPFYDNQDSEPQDTNELVAKYSDNEDEREESVSISALSSNDESDRIASESHEAAVDYSDDQEKISDAGTSAQYSDQMATTNVDVDGYQTFSDEDEEDSVLDQDTELRAARLALLRKRRVKKKAKRYSSITGNPVPSLPSNVVKGLFTSFTTPSTGIIPTSQSKGKIVVEKGAADAVEDLSHHFFSQITHALVSQVEQSSRSNITEKDIIALMKSQGQVSARNSLSFLARRYLPRELSDLITSTTAPEGSSGRKHKVPRKKAIEIATNTKQDDSITSP